MSEKQSQLKAFDGVDKQSVDNFIQELKKQLEDG